MRWYLCGAYLITKNVDHAPEKRIRKCALFVIVVYLSLNYFRFVDFLLYGSTSLHWYLRNLKRELLYHCR
jgi:hypothetical protein